MKHQEAFIDGRKEGPVFSISEWMTIMEQDRHPKCGEGKSYVLCSRCPFASSGGGCGARSGGSEAIYRKENVWRKKLELI